MVQIAAAYQTRQQQTLPSEEFRFEECFDHLIHPSLWQQRVFPSFREKDLAAGRFGPEGLILAVL
ncbi:MAG: hypothetical protein ACKPKO_38835, partial [Candidatus Fonsibacter sp.]